MSFSTKRTLARLRGAVNDPVTAAEIRARSRAGLPCDLVTYKVQLIYFRQTGKFLASAETVIARDELSDIWKEIDELRRMGRLPGIRPGAGRDLLIVVDVPDHPKRVLQLVMPPFIDDDDVTPARTSTGEMMPLVRVPLDEIPRTTTRDVVRIDPGAADPDPEADTVVIPNDDITPVDRPIRKVPSPDEAKG